ncbi:HYR domain-containing protein [Zunongwangia sp. H14]|uniref:HYR domain-containing protein n=1 Tax=Zunongwangia sp. H14 TaxID=3240792 RepID=UPI0035686B00
MFSFLPSSSRASGKLRYGVFLPVLILFFAFQNVVGQNPNYTYNASNSINLDRFGITINDAFNPEAKINRLIISVEVNPEGERFVLTYGNGIKKIGNNNQLTNFIPNQSNRLSNPMDFAINSEGKFFVATNESNRRFIRVYSPEGIYLPNEDLGDGSYGTGANKFRGPMGLAFDKEDNLYVADHYIGNSTPPSNPSFIKIYRKDASGNYKNNLIKEFDKVQGTLLNFPYRLAVNSKGYLYMAELGQNNNASVKVLQFDENYNPTQIDEISGGPIGSPGSIIVDDFDNIFIADFGRDLDLARVLEATNDVDEFYDVFEIIKEGIADNEFNIDVYNPNNTYRSTISSQIDFPVDLAISDCGSLYVNNAIFDGRIRTIFGQRIPDITIDFDLEAYQRSPGYDTDAPVLVSCIEDREGSLTNGSFELPDYTNLPVFTDNCDDNLEFVQAPVEGTSITETTEVSIIARDDAGNESEACIFQVIIEEEEQEAPEFIFCPPDQPNVLVDEGQCGAIVTFNPPTARAGEDNIEPVQIEGPASGEEFPVGPTIVIFEVSNQAGTDTCSFTVTVRDNEDPLISDCPSDLEYSVEYGETGTTVNYTAPSATDNCEISNFGLTAGFAPGEVFPVGKTTVTYTATDANGNTTTCSFIVNVIENADMDPPQFTNCPQNNITVTAARGKCDVAAPFPMPEATDNSGDVNIELISDLGFQDRFSVGEHVVTYTATDAAGNMTECSFNVIVTEDVVPQITCPDPKTAIFDPETGFTIPDYVGELIVSDNCTPEENLQITQTPAAGTVVYESQEISFTVTDASGNTGNCGFQLTLEEEEEELEITCPADQDFNPDENCQYVLEDYTNLATVNLSGATISQSPGPGTVINGELQIISLTANLDGESVSCTFTLTRRDTGVPYVICPGNQTVNYNSAEGFIIPNYIPQSEVSDNCAIASVEQSPEPGVLIQENTEVTITATDAAGNSYTCRFSVFIEEENPFTFECTGDQNGSLDENCEFEVPDYTVSLRQEFPQAEFTQSPEAGAFISTGTTVTINGTLDGENYSCTFQLNLSDTSAPQITCPNPKAENFDPEEGFMVPDYYEELLVSDNCTSEESLQITQSPAVGEIIYASQQISFTVTDASGNTGNCSFQLTLEEEEENPGACRDNSVQLDNNGQAVPDPALFYNGNPAEDNVSLSLNRNLLTCDDLGETVLELTITTNAGTETTCTVTALVKDNLEPVFECPDSITGGFEITEGYEVPDFSFNYPASDNCLGELEYSQIPEPGTVLYEVENYPVTLSATDASGNTGSCTFILDFTAMDSFDLLCNGEIRVQPDENCEFRLPDLADEYTYFPEVAVISQSVPTGQLLTEDTHVTITATYNGQTRTCEIEVILVDYDGPVFSCLPLQNVPYTPSEGFILPDYSEQVEVTDNCGITSVVQDPLPGVEINEDTTVTITAEDTFGNISNCYIYVYLEEEQNGNGNNLPVASDDYYETFHNQTLMVAAPGVLENDNDADGDNLSATLQNGPAFGTVSLNADGSFTYVPQQDYTGPDTFSYFASDGEGNSNLAVVHIEVKYDPPVARNDNYSTPQDTQLQVSAEEGLLQNDSDPDGDNLTVIQVSEVSNGTLNLQPDGSFTYTPNTGFSGTDSFTYYVTDGGGESAEATVTINVIGSGTSAFIDCQEIITLNLDENGTASAALSDLYASKSDNVEVAANNLNFDCSDFDNDNFIELTYSGALNGSCSVEVILRDNIAPVAECVDAYELSLSGGTANLSAEELNFNSSDNCEIINMSIDKTAFTTADIGENIVTLTVIDAAGNTDSCQAVVTVTEANTGGGEVSCVNGVTLELDQNGEAVLDINDVYTGNPQGELSLSRSLYTCADNGVSRQRFYYTENGQETFCEFSVTVADNLGPQIVANPVPLQLDENGQAVLTEELLRNTVVATDNCSEELTYEFGPKDFTCKDVGQNFIDLEVTDENGNTTAARVAVFVEAAPGLCQPQEWDFIRVYPNPNSGRFKVLAPSNVIIEKILVFDMRGRYLLERQFEEELPGQEYDMDLGELETAVYVLQIFTNTDDQEEIEIRRIIYE